jgi:hypothetical protein
MTLFTFAGRVAVTVSVLGTPYTLVATTDMGRPSGKLQLVYHAPFDQALEVGSIREIVTDLKTLAEDTIKLGGAALKTNLTTSLDDLVAQANRIPGFGEVLRTLQAPPATTLADARVRITDLELVLEAPAGDPPPGGAQLPLKSGALTIGLGLDFRPRTPAEQPKRILGVALDSITLLVAFELTV